MKLVATLQDLVVSLLLPTLARSPSISSPVMLPLCTSAQILILPTRLPLWRILREPCLSAKETHSLILLTLSKESCTTLRLLMSKQLLLMMRISCKYLCGSTRQSTMNLKLTMPLMKSKGCKSNMTDSLRHSKSPSMTWQQMLKLHSLMQASKPRQASL